MSEMRSLLADAAARAMSGAGEAFSPALWRALEDAGLAAAWLAEDKGGAGADLGDTMAILRVAGRHALAAPLAETLLAAWLLSESRLAIPAGPLSIAPVERGALPTLARAGKGWRLSGEARHVPWARDAKALAVLATHDGRIHVARVAVDKSALTHGENLAGEPRDAVRFGDVVLAADAVAPAGVDFDALWRRGALCRAATMAGALDEVLDLTVRYCGERVQFGRPIGKFQAIQQQVAELAAMVAASGVAADAASAAAERGNATFAIAAAKARIGEAAGPAAAIAHQVHGAMGFAREHRLNLYTRRLWSWREEFGDESYWWGWLGRAAARVGGDALWPFLTGPRDEAKP
ncbi:MAG TPA: acyl-CoA dehydrogenase family protein [Stellaceae bacterium]|nr:acyl-CoA dehydrogenase family protein [Stellaceae bacterium]